MESGRRITVDGNEAAASVAYRTSEVIAIYPITPASPMGELADEWAAAGRPNLWGTVPQVVEMQSEGGAAGAVHGALQAGALTTTFTASQGLLLMIPNLYKIAGELNAFCMHVAARTVATHALSIFGDHSDVMACRQTGFALVASGSVQEAHDLAAISHAAALRSRVPFLHFFDGFRTSHEIAKIEAIGDDDLRRLIDPQALREHRERALTPDRPVLRGSAQNPDCFFQAREASNPFHADCPRIVREEMERFEAMTGRRYRPFDYAGHPRAERVIVIMGSGAETVHELVEWMNARGEAVGLIKVRLYRPFDAEAFAAALPETARAVAVLDRTKEPGAVGEPLYLDVVAALREARDRGTSHPRGELRIVGGRYGLASKEFNPAMAKAVFDELARPQPRNHFTVGIVDDVTGLSLPVDPGFDIEPDDVVRAVFFGLGSDGTVGANKNSIKIIGEETDSYVQGHFVYDSKKAGTVTVSHLRFGPRPIRSTYRIRRAGFVACHQPGFLDRFDVLEAAAPGAVFLLNSPLPPERVWDSLPREAQAAIRERGLQLHAIDACRVARAAGCGPRINTVMQTCFFALAGVLPLDRAIEAIREATRRTYGRKGEAAVARNLAAIDRALENLHRIPVTAAGAPGRPLPPLVPPEAPDFVRRVTAVMAAGKGDLLPVSAFPADGTWPLGTGRWERPNLALEIPIWDPDLCIQCNKCALICPHAAIRAKVLPPEVARAAPAGFEVRPYRASEFRGLLYRIQVAPEACTGCRLCAEICPATDRSDPGRRAIELRPKEPHLERERRNWEFFRAAPEPDRTRVRPDAKGSQFLEPLFETSGACAGCGETPYLRLLTQLFGDRVVIANATGCSSIFGGNLPTTPYGANREGRGPAWSNSLFEDNAEFGYGIRLAIDGHRERACALLRRLAGEVGPDVARGLLEADQTTEAGIAAQRRRVEALRARLRDADGEEARELDRLADYLVDKSVWIVGGDGWAYDIGSAGLDHVLAGKRNVHLLVLDTGVYSNTGGQQSKATPLGAVAKFAVSGKEDPRKDLGLQAMTYGHVYVAQVALGGRDAQAVQALREADAYPGPSLVIAYCHCIAHGYDLARGAAQQKLAVDSGFWPVYRFDPRRAARGEPPLQLDSGPPRAPVEAFLRNEARFRAVESADPKRFRILMELARLETERRIAVYRQLARLTVPPSGAADDGEGAAAAPAVGAVGT